jgi:cysteinyl-tRNA synthetase
VPNLWTMQKPYKRNDTQFGMLTHALDNIKAANLSAIVSINCGPGRDDLCGGSDMSVYSNQEAQDAWLSMLEDVVTTFGDRSEIIAWNPMAEPTPDAYFNDRKQDFRMSAPFWNGFANKAIIRIRATGEKRPVVIEPVFRGDIEAISYLARSSDSNVIYSIRTFEPYAYTHQEGPDFEYDYPGDVGDIDYDRDELEKMLKPALDFKKAHSVPMLVGAYGGMRVVPYMGNYIGDMVYLLEKYNLSHTYYAWNVDAFSLQYGPNGSELALNSETFLPILKSWMNNPPPEIKMTPLNGVKTFAYVIQDPQDSIAEMSKSRYDMLVIDEVRSIISNYSMSSAVRKLKNSHSKSGSHKMVLAYMSIGEAEDYRWYWKGWSTSTEWVVAENPLWDGNYIVEYWHPKWKKVISDYLSMIAADGFDGVALDTVDVYELDKIKILGDKQKKDPKKEMMNFVCEIYRQARERGMLVIAQGALDLGASKEYLSCIDGVVQEAIWYDATGSKEGDNKVDPKETSSFIKKLRVFQLAGLPVFSIDYAVEEHNANEAYFFAAQQGYVEYATMLSLDKLSSTPPEGI